MVVRKSVMFDRYIRKKCARSISVSVSRVIVMLCLVPGLLLLEKEAYAANCSDINVSGSSWAVGQGVPSRSNGIYEGTGTGCNGDVADLNATPPQYGLGWQCVELAQRLYNTRGWYSGRFSGVNYASQIYSNASLNGWSKVAQGSIVLTSIQPGDMVITSDGTYGHVMIVDRIDIQSDKVYIVDQNGNTSGLKALDLSNGSLSYDGWPMTFSGVVHDPNNNIANPSTPLIIYRNNTALNGKSGINDQWTWLTSSATTSNFQVSGGRIAFLDSSGNLYVKEGLYGAWSNIAANVDDFRITGDKIITQKGTTLYGKSGISDPWTWLTSSANSSNFQVVGNRIAFLDGQNLYMKEGLGGAWVVVRTSVNDFRVTADRIVARVGTNLYGNDEIDSTWTWLTGSASSGNFQIAGSRIAFIDNGTLYMKDGLGGAWVIIRTSVDDFRMTAGRTVARIGTNLYGNDEVDNTWTWMTGSATTGDFQVSGIRIAFTQGSNLYIKESLSGQWVVATSNANSGFKIF